MRIMHNLSAEMIIRNLNRIMECPDNTVGVARMTGSNLRTLNEEGEKKVFSGNKGSKVNLTA